VLPEGEQKQSLLDYRDSQAMVLVEFPTCHPITAGGKHSKDPKGKEVIST
jgi:hypothetical protein